MTASRKGCALAAGTRVRVDAPTVAGTINTDALADFAVNGLFSATSPNGTIGGGATTLLALTVNSTGRPLTIQVGGSSNTDFDDANVFLTLYRDGDGSPLAQAAGARGQSLAMITRIALPPGQYVFRLQGVSNRGGSSVSYPALIVQESKK